MVCAGLGCRSPVAAWVTWGRDGDRYLGCIPGGGFFCGPCGALVAQQAGELEDRPSR